jgi:hypothetical protein
MSGKPAPEEVARKWAAALGAFAVASEPLTCRNLRVPDGEEAVCALEAAKFISWTGDWHDPRRYVITEKGRLALSHATGQADPVMVERLEREIYGKRRAARLYD